MLPKELIILVIYAAPFVYCIEKEEKLETYCNIDGKKVLHCVSDKFLSISIDPALLLTGLDLSDTSLRLAEHLSPAYIRIAGPSTKSVKYVDNEYKSRDRLSEDGNNVVVTPSMWFGINEWLNLAKLTPVFGINDADTDRGVWNPKSALPLLEISDKLNVTCYWQLGFDNSERDRMQYTQALNLLHHIISEFPGRNESWKIVGSDISNIPSVYAENVLEEIQNIVTSVMWEPSNVSENSFPEKDWSWKVLQQERFKQYASIWTTVPKSSDQVSFASTMLWASQIGNAAKFGYEVVFRQPGLQELFSDTPVYWFSLLYKKIMGRHVLDAKTTSFHSGCSVYAHCTTKVNIPKQEAMTLMIINKNNQSYKVKVKLERKPIDKTMEVQSYILTAPDLNSTEMYLNGNKLTPALLGENNSFEPRVWKVKTKPHISLELPPLSIGFFVLPTTRLKVFPNNENDMNIPPEQISEDESVFHSEYSSKGPIRDNLKLDIIGDKKQELPEENAPNANPTWKIKLDLLRQALQYVPMQDSIEYEANHRGRKFFSDKAKLIEQAKMQNNKIDGVGSPVLENNKNIDAGPISKVIDLISEEVENRKNGASQEVITIEEEIVIPIENANMMFLDSKFKGTIPKENVRLQRDINMQLLERQNIFGTTSAKYSNGDNNDHFYKYNNGHSKNTQKRPARQARDINMKLLGFKSKLEDNRQRMEDKKYELVGNSQSRRKSIKDRISKLRNKNRFKRDINMDLLKIKSEVQKKKPQRDERKSLFKDREEKKATIRKPGQTSDELLAELEEEPFIEQKNKLQPKIDVYAELAIPADEEDMDYNMNENTKPKRPNIFDKKTRGHSFDTISNLDVRRKPKSKKNKEEDISDDIQILTTSEEFTDIEDDYPCIHEYFGQQNKKSGTRKHTMWELGENDYSVREHKKKKSTRGKMSDVPDIMNSEEKDSFDYLRKKRSIEPSATEFKNYIVELGEVDYFNGPTMSQNEMEDSSETAEVEIIDSFQSSPKPQQRLISIKTSEDIKATEKNDVNNISANIEDDAAVDLEIGFAENKMIKGIDSLEQLRSKRDITQQIQEDVNEKVHDIEGYLKDFEKETKNNVEELERIMSKDKHLLHGDMATKLTPFQPGDKTDFMENAKNGILGDIKKSEREKTTEIPADAVLLKEYLTHNKNEIDKLLLKEFELYKKIEEGQQNMIQYILQENKNSQLMKNNLEKVIPERGIMDMNIENTNMKIKNQITDLEKSFKDMISGNNKFNFIPTSQLVKRSIFDNTCDILERYKPLTKNLKPWKPSDILSLKRDVRFLPIPILKPPIDPQIFKNGLDSKSLFNMRRKRNIDDNHLDNDIDAHMNEIEKDDRYIHPKSNMERQDYKLMPSSEKDNKIRNEDIKRNKLNTGALEHNEHVLSSAHDSKGNTERTHEKVESDLSIKSDIQIKPKFMQEEGTTVDPIIYYTFNDDFEKEIESEADTTSESVNTMAAAITRNYQDLPSKQEQTIFQNVVSSVSDFFSNIGRQLGHYMKEIGF